MGDNRNRPVSAGLFVALMQAMLAGAVKPTRSGMERAIFEAAFEVAKLRWRKITGAPVMCSLQWGDNGCVVMPPGAHDLWLMSETTAIAENALHLLRTRI